MNPSLHCKNTFSPSTSGFLLVNLWSVLCEFFYTGHHYCLHGMHPKPLPHTWISLPWVGLKSPTALNFSTWKFHIKLSMFKMVLLVLSPVQLCGANPIWNSQPHPCLRPSPPYHPPFKEHALSQHHSKGFTCFHPHSHLLLELKSPPSLILTKARASTAGLSHPGGRWVWDHTPAWGTRWSQPPLLMTPLPCHGPSLWKVYKLHRFSILVTKPGCNFQSVEGKLSDLITLITLWHAATCQTENSVYHTG